MRLREFVEKGPGARRKMTTRCKEQIGSTAKENKIKGNENENGGEEDRIGLRA